MKYRNYVLAVASVLTVFITPLAYGETASVLPAGVSRVNLKATHYLPIDERYGPDGDVEDAAVDYNANLNSTVFPDLGLVEGFLMMTPGTGSIGRTIVDFEYRLEGIEFNYQVGVTDRFTVGLKIPYWKRKNRVTASVDTSSANLGKNPGFGLLAPPAGSLPFIKISDGGIPVSDEDVQALLGQGLYINGVQATSGFGYKRFESWDDEGLGDIQVGGRYQYYRTDPWRLAFSGGLNIPSGKVDNPDNLVDLSFGTSAYALMFSLNNDYKLNDQWSFNATFRYDWVLPEDQRLRVPEDVNIPITGNEETVDRDKGDLFWADLSAVYTATPEWSFLLNYVFITKDEDDVSGDFDFAYGSLEAETEFEAHEAIIGVTYSTLSKFRDKEAAIPMKLGFSYRNRFDGKNNAFKSEYIQATASVYF